MSPNYAVIGAALILGVAVGLLYAWHPALGIGAAVYLLVFNSPRR